MNNATPNDSQQASPVLQDGAFARVASGIGERLFKEAYFSLAEKFYRAATICDAPDEATCTHYIATLFEQGKFAEAETLGRAHYVRFAKSHVFCTEYIRVLLRAEKNQEALKICKSFAHDRSAHRSAPFLKEYATALYKTGNYRHAEEKAFKSLALEETTWIYDVLIGCFIKNGSFAANESFMLVRLRDNPQNPAWRLMWLARFYANWSKSIALDDAEESQRKLTMARQYIDEACKSLQYIKEPADKAFYRVCIDEVAKNIAARMEGRESPGVQLPEPDWERCQAPPDHLVHDQSFAVDAYKKAKQILDAGKAADAVPFIRLAILCDPLNTVTICRNFIARLFSKKEYKVLEQIGDEHYGTLKDDVQFVLHYATALISTRKDDKAVQICERLADREAAKCDANFQHIYGHALFNIKNHSKAQTAYLKSLEICEGRTDYDNLINCFSHTGAFPAHEKLMVQRLLVAEKSDNPVAFRRMLLARFYFKWSEYLRLKDPDAAQRKLYTAWDHIDSADFYAQNNPGDTPHEKEELERIAALSRDIKAKIDGFEPPTQFRPGPSQG